MRVLVAVGSIGGLGCLTAGSAIAQAWAELGDEVAVVPMASAGTELAAAVAALSPGLEYEDLTMGGEVGAAPLGIVEEAELARPLLGLYGCNATRGREEGWPLEDVLAADAEAQAWLSANWPAQPELGREPGSGAHGGLGARVLGSGGRLLTGPQLCAELSGLAGSIAAADLVVTGCESLDFGTFGGPVVAELTRLCDQATAPLVVLCGANFISSRELRSAGIEAAHVVVDPESGDCARDQLSRAAKRLARSWHW